MVDAANTTRLYQNLQLYNAGNATAAIDAKFNTEFTEAFLRKAGDFDGSIVRLSLPMSGLPYFQLTAANPMYVTLSWRNVDYKTQVSLIDVSGGTAPTSVYFINQFVDSVNVALAASYTAVTAANPTDYNLFPGHQPYIQYDRVTQLFSLVTDVGSWENSAAIGNPAIWFSWSLMSNFSNMPYIFKSYNSASGKDCQIRIVSRPNNTIPSLAFESGGGGQSISTGGLLTSALAIGTTYTSLAVSAITVALPVGTIINLNNSFPQVLIVVSAAAAVGATSISVASFKAMQGEGVNAPIFYYLPWQIYTTDDTPSVVNWFAYNRIVVTTNRMPVRSEMSPSVSLLGQFTTQNILTDFVVTPSERLTSNTALLMVPQPQYRWFDLLSESPLSVLDLNFYGADYTGNLVQIQIEPGQAVNVKLLFDRKTKASEHLHCDDRIRAVDESTAGGKFGKRRRTDF